MRGKVVDIVYQLQQEGITPAYAGKRWQKLRKTRTPQDHPRLCGEKLKTADTLKWLPRITPAYAGKSHFVRQDKVCT